MVKHNAKMMVKLIEFCKNAKRDGFRTELNYDTIKAIEGTVVKIGKLHPKAVRELLFTFLEKFTTGLFNRISTTEESPRGNQPLTARTIGQESCVTDNELPEVQEPFLPPLEDRDQVFTLVLDLDETLIHFIEQDPSTIQKNIENSGNITSRTNKTNKSKVSTQSVEMEDEELGGHFLIRPGAREFLEKMSQHYEVVIFTAAMQEYADWVLDILDTGNWISYRLYRQHAVRDGAVFIKDLSRLGRKLSNMIIVDNVAQNFQR